MRTFPSLTRLTPDERVWRLDWFGECAYPGSVRARTQPSIKVAISPLCCEPDDSDALPLSGCTDYSNQREIWLPITALPLLKIGDLWQDGHLIASPGYHVETFRNVRIETGNTSFIKAGLAIDGKFLIPLGAHPWHRRQTQAYCVAVSLADGRRLLVPCVEIIRFYFGSSSNLLQRLFCAPLTADALWLSQSFDVATRHLHLVLGYGLSWESASDVARIAGSRFAWRAAAGIHASCQTGDDDPPTDSADASYTTPRDTILIWFTFIQMLRRRERTAACFRPASISLISDFRAHRHDIQCLTLHLKCTIVVPTAVRNLDVTRGGLWLTRTQLDRSEKHSRTSGMSNP